MKPRDFVKCEHCGYDEEEVMIIEAKLKIMKRAFVLMAQGIKNRDVDLLQEGVDMADPVMLDMDLKVQAFDLEDGEAPPDFSQASDRTQ